MLKIGIIGYGKMGKIRHKAIQLTKLAKVVHICDKKIKKQNSSILFSKSPDQIINDPIIDAIFICTPNFLNKPLTIKSLKAGKHVFCEKPPAFKAGDVKKIIKVEKLSRKKLMYGFNHRYHASIQKMKELIVGETYGKILWMRGRYGKSVDKSFYKDWRSKKEKAGGGILMDQGIHMLDLFLYLGGNFDKVHAIVSNLYWNLDVEDNVFAILKNLKTGMSASFHSTMTQWRNLFALEIFLEKGYLVLNGLKTSSNSYGKEILTIAKNRTSAPVATWRDEKKIIFNRDNSFKMEIKEFFSSNKRKKKS